MIDKLIRWSLAHRPIVVALASAFLVWGGWTASRMPLDVLPDLTAPTVTILVEAPGMDPLDLEPLVTLPIESALNGSVGIRRVRSATAVGVAVVWVEFDWGQDVARARQTVTEKLTLVAAALPPGVKPPFLAPVSSIMGEVLFVDLESNRHSPIELRTAADTIVRRRLLAVPGVSQVIATGGEQKQYEVVIDAARLQAHGVSIADVERALTAANRNATAGFTAAEGQEYLVRGVGRFTNAGDIGATVVKIHDTVPVLVRDLGAVQIGAAIRRGDASHNAKPAVIIGIQKQPGANTLQLTEQVDATLDEIQRTLPQGMTIHRDLFRSADFIEQSLQNLFRAFIEGAGLVIVVVFVFLVNIRAAAITLLAMPLSLLAAVVALDRFGLSINSMSLGGLAIAIGELVDDAIIDVENVVRRLRENAKLPDGRKPALEIVYDASTEIRHSVVFATVIVALVFLPLFLLGSVEGRLLRPLGFAYVVALTASLVVALTVTPVLCSWLLPGSATVVTGEEPRLTRWLKRWYEPWLLRSLRHWKTVAAGAAAMLLVACAGIAMAGRSFLPEFNEGALTVSAVTIPGTSLADSNALGNALERLMLEVPEVTSTARRTGRAELDEHVQGVESSEIDVRLDMKNRPKDEVLSEIREKGSLLPGTNVTVGQPISHRIDHMLSGTRANVAVKIFGDDLQMLRSLAAQVQAQMAQVDGVVDLSTEAQADIPTLRVKVEADAAARYGIPSGEAAAALQTARAGTVVGQVLEGQVAFPLVIRYARDGRSSDLDAVGATMIEAADRSQVPLSAVATIERDRGPNFIMRENVQRRIVVQCNVSGRDLRSVVDDVQQRVARAVKLPQGYHIEYGGQFESEAQASRQLLWLSLGVIAAIFFVLASAFGSARDATLVMLNLPLALIGGVAGVYLAGGVLSVASIVGFITLFGIATRNGIMLVSHIRHVRENEGVSDFHEAVVRGATERLIPILMTALAAGLALVPIAMSTGAPGSEIQAPMAMVILFGLLSSTALNMIVVPVLYERFGRR